MFKIVKNVDGTVDKWVKQPDAGSEEAFHFRVNALHRSAVWNSDVHLTDEELYRGAKDLKDAEFDHLPDSVLDKYDKQRSNIQS